MAQLVRTQAGQAFQYEVVTVSNTTIGLTQRLFIKGQPAKRAIITNELGVIRYRTDAQAAVSATEGHQLYPRDVLVLEGINNLVQFSAIRQDTTDAKLRITYER